MDHARNKSARTAPRFCQFFPELDLVLATLVTHGERPKRLDGAPLCARFYAPERWGEVV
jgi:hypothetical protein